MIPSNVDEIKIWSKRTARLNRELLELCLAKAETVEVAIFSLLISAVAIQRSHSHIWNHGELVDLLEALALLEHNGDPIGAATNDDRDDDRGDSESGRESGREGVE